MLKNKVTLVNWLMWLTACGPISTWEVVTAFKGTMRCPSSLLMYSFPKSCGSERLSSNLQDHLVLVGAFLDQVTIVLRVGVMKEREDASLRYAVKLGLIAQNIDLQVWRVVEKVGVDKQKAGIFLHLRQQLARRVIDLIGINPGQRIGELPLHV